MVCKGRPIVCNAITLPETSIPKGLGGMIGKARKMILEAICLQSKGCEGYAGGLGWAQEGQSRQAVQVSKTNFSLGREASQRTECRPQSQCGKGCWATVEAELCREVGDGIYFSIPNHPGGLKGQSCFKAWFDAYPDV